MRYKCIVKYDGTFFHGFQVQDGLRSVQEVIEKALFIILKEKVSVFASGRTDSGVHALGQVIHFDSDKIIPPSNMKRALNSYLDKDVYIVSVKHVDASFHSRYSAIKKEYHYLVDFGEYDPLKKNYRYYFPYKKIDHQKMIEASKIFIGEHDFRSFTKNQDLQNTIRTIYSLDFCYDESLLTIKIVGNGFMHNMVRILVAMLLEVGRNKYSIEELKSILDEKNRRFAPKTAPSCGLYLFKVYYDEES